MKIEKSGNITSNLDGKRIPLNSQQRAEKSIEKLYPYIGANNIMDYIDEYIFDEKIMCLAEDGGSWGAKQICANIYNEKCWVNNHAHVLKENGKANLEYLRYFLNEADLNKYITGTTRGKLTKSALNSIEVPLPSLEIQLHIANILSKAESLIAQRKESIHMLDEYLKSVFLEMFGDPEHNINNYPVVELESLCSEIVDCPHSTPRKVADKTEYPCIRTSELSNGYIDWDSMQYLDEEEYQIRTKRLIPIGGDIVYAREGTFGEAVVLPESHKFSLGQRTMLFRPDKTKTNSIFLWAMVRSDYVYRQAKRKNSGSTVGHVNVKDIKKFNILQPPQELQNKFSSIVLKLENLKAQYQQSLQELENLYGSLSQKAFKGELSIKDESLLSSAELSRSMAAEPETKYEKLK